VLFSSAIHKAALLLHKPAAAAWYTTAAFEGS
jgi:hypothetical protein